MTLAISLLVLQLVILPPVFALWLGAPRPMSKVHWALLALVIGAYFATMWFAGPWSWLHINLKLALPFLFILAFGLSARKLSGVPVGPPLSLRSLFPLVVLFLVGALFVVQLVSALRGTVTPAGAVDVTFPLEDGNFVVAHGGSSPILNYHNVVRAQAFALDIVALNKQGRRADGLLPEDLDRYAVYNARVVSPCDGQVAATDDGHQDQAPGLPNEPKFPAGNHVVVECLGLRIILAHLQPGSLAVEAGDQVTGGDLVGLVGNSGNTSEPHLHIHAEKADPNTEILHGQGVPLTFGGRFLIRNDIVEN